ncbi:MAG: hypothetical protein HN336_00580 [Lentimicrobiaceae bacterium]|jgi:hypothetical protein|nr:hypothetical protein [Lentimicrobiaceae bacterium]MBT3453846.1 hypothetical protein [Lentimicrobiaceae bacterium]MBT3819525.1 hypothetical protein [Lentimicrobiaceae bacterium]MBT4061666.1 hypothetical protein [Lentimicrobiaceae bacterium]MBT4190219.1 hypothetical protein [Lentimicrobiaceae bacterium]
MKKKNLILISVLSALLIFPSCEKDDDGPGSDSVSEYSSSVNNVYDAQYNFIVKNQEFETVDFTSMPIEDVKPYVDEYIASAQQYLDALNHIVEFENNKKSSAKNLLDGPDCSLLDFVPTLDNGLGPGLVKSVGDIVKKNNEEMAQIQKDWEDGLISANEYYEAVGKLPQKNGGKALGLGVGAIMGTGAAIVTGAVVGTATAPAIATIAIVGGTVGVLTTWYANWTMNNKDGDPQYFMLTGKTEVGGSIPLNMFGANANIVVSIDGYAPVAIANFKLPDGGINKTIEIDAVKLEDADWGGSTEVCLYEEPMTASSCTEVQFVSGSPSPSDPGPGEGVTVTATLVPPVADCSISFSIVGTDGYSNSATNNSDVGGQATFYIPGGDEGVVDNVTITSSNGKTYTVTYVF